MDSSKFLESVRCADCGESDPIVLEFDHRERALKVASVSRMMATSTWSTGLTEIAKCEIRRVNCHRRQTSSQFGWTKQLQVVAPL